MTDLLAEVEAPSDAELISRVRGGDVAAYGQLFTRHKDSANRLARQLVRGSDSDDLVAEAFAKVLTVLQSGGGPDVAFRAYLLTAVRRLHVDRVRTAQRVQTTDDLTPFDPGVPFRDTAVDGFESGAAAKAFASLPERWQLVLWHLEVEGQKPADIAPLLGMSANSVSALAYRAREGLRQAFLTMHISDLSETDCRWVNEHLGAFIRRGLSKRDSAKVQDHLDQCRRCTAMYLELTEVNDNLAGIIGPLVLGAAAAGYLASTGVGSAGVLGVVSRLKDFVGANTGAASAAGVTVGIAAAAVAVFTLGTGGGHPEAKAPEAPVGVTSAAPSSRASSEVGPSASPALTAAPTIAPTPTLSPVVAAPSTALPTPTPTETPSATESPSAEPTEAPADVPVSLAGTTVDDDGVHLRAAGSPLPPTVTVLLTSASDGVRFADNGDCVPADGGRQATCSLSPGGAGGPVPGTAVQPDLTSFAAELPFNSLADEPDVDIDVGFVLPAGFRLDDTGGAAMTRFRHVMRQDVDVALTIPGIPIRPDGPGDVYRVPAALGVSGVAQNRVHDVTYSASGGRFLTGDGSLVPSVTRSRGDDLTFQVVPDDPQRPAVRISASLPSPLVDSDPGDDAAAASLAPYDVSLENLQPVTPTADENGTQTFTATVHDDGFPGSLVYTALDEPADDNSPGSVLEPTSVDGDTVTFTVSGDVDRTLGIRVALPTGFTDANPANNTARADFTVPRDVDAELSVPSGPVRPGPDDVYSVNPSLTLTGTGSRGVSEVTYHLTGGTFLDGTTSTTRSRDDDTPLQIVPSDRSTPDVELTVSVPAPFTDADATNDSVTLALRPYDPQLTGLTASSATADDEGVQEFTATVDEDGLDGVTYRLQNPAPDDELVGAPRVVGSTVTVRVRSTGSAHDVTLEAVAPLGFTDADPLNSAATARWSPQPPPALHTDLRLTPLTPEQPVPNRKDGRYHLATTLHVDGDRPTSVTLTIADGSNATFVRVGGCTVSSNGKQALCDYPVDGTRLRLVLAAPTDQATEVTITVSAPALFTETETDDNSRTTTLQPAPRPSVTEVELSLPVGTGPLRPRTGDVYSVPLTLGLTGPAADRVAKIRYTVEGGAFVDGRTSVIRSAGERGLKFEVVPDDPIRPVVSITASVPAGAQDTVVHTDSVALPLEPYDLALTDPRALTESADSQGRQRFTATVVDDDFPGRLAYALVNPASGDRLLGHVTRKGDTVTFEVSSEATAVHDVLVEVALPPGYHDADPTDNVVAVPWTPPRADAAPVDVRLLNLLPAVARPDVGDEFVLTGMVAFEGDLTHVDYTVSGAAFVPDGDCSTTTCTLTTTSAPTFRLHRLHGSGPSEVTITAHVPAGFRDTHPENDSASAVLKPYDVSLTGLSSGDDAAGEDGNQTFQAHLDVDGFDGDLSFELADGPADARLLRTWVSDGRVTFTVHSDTESPHPVAVRVVMPDGFEDADPSNNTAAGATFTPFPRAANLELSAGYASYDTKSQRGFIAVSVENAPSGVLTFSLGGHRLAELTESANCDVSADHQTATCQVSRPGTFTTNFGIHLPPGQSVSLSVTAAGSLGADQSDTVELGKP